MNTELVRQPNLISTIWGGAFYLSAKPGNDSVPVYKIQDADL